MQTMILSRNQLLHEVARRYVVKGLGGKNFNAIPYDANVVLRAPLCPGGSNHPLYGKENVRQLWWAPLPSLIGDVKFIDSFVNEDGTAVTAEFHCKILNPSCTLRIIDRFIVNEEGKIVEQENFFDPRYVTDPSSNV
ncbi:MAG TPA: nuclear transport factor 2 family protein [Chitinophagaceae bacterium]|nr:nuclear transport factor 2 family protein [Chitinophagaceae bacterium]